METKLPFTPPLKPGLVAIFLTVKMPTFARQLNVVGQVINPDSGSPTVNS